MGLWLFSVGLNSAKIWKQSSFLWSLCPLTLHWAVLTRRLLLKNGMMRKGLRATRSWLWHGPMVDFLPMNKKMTTFFFSYLGCDIGGAKEPGVIYFPTNWGAKEPQNLPNHRVDMEVRNSTCNPKIIAIFVGAITPFTTIVGAHLEWFLIFLASAKPDPTEAGGEMFPNLYNFVRETVDDVVADLIVIPNMVAVPIEPRAIEGCCFVPVCFPKTGVPSFKKTM